ncbi:MAG: hypothetical protein IT337_18480 [Thermomicrobiales bacterium]|nr:hypothetical protein [Thermomicrobiales bacterium]
MAGRRGRPPKYNADVHKAIVDNLRMGCSRTTAAELAGINRITLTDWCAKYPTFSGDVEEAIASCKRTASATIRQAILKGDVQSAFRYLALQERSEWTETKDVNVTVAVTVEQVAERIAREEGLDPADVIAEAERILAETR